MAFLTKLNIVALVLILLSISGAWCSSASSLHKREVQNSKWYSDCRSRYRKLDVMNCENAGALTYMERAAWSESLKKALSPPPPPMKKPPPRMRADPPSNSNT